MLCAERFKIYRADGLMSATPISTRRQNNRPISPVRQLNLIIEFGSSALSRISRSLCFELASTLLASLKSLAELPNLADRATKDCLAVSVWLKSIQAIQVKLGK